MASALAEPARRTLANKIQATRCDLEIVVVM